MAILSFRKFTKAEEPPGIHRAISAAQNIPLWKRFGLRRLTSGRTLLHVRPEGLEQAMGATARPQNQLNPRSDAQNDRHGIAPINPGNTLPFRGLCPQEGYIPADAGICFSQDVSLARESFQLRLLGASLAKGARFSAHDKAIHPGSGAQQPQIPSRHWSLGITLCVARAIGRILCGAVLRWARVFRRRQTNTNLAHRPVSANRDAAMRHGFATSPFTQDQADAASHKSED